MQWAGMPHRTQARTGAVPLSYLGLPYVQAVAEQRQHQGAVQRGGLGACQVDQPLNRLKDLFLGQRRDVVDGTWPFQ